MSPRVKGSTVAGTSWSRFHLLATMWLLCLLAGSACRVVKETAKLPVKTMTAVVPGARPTQTDPAVLQAELQRYADDFAGRTSAALGQYARQLNSPESRAEALNWKLTLSFSALTIATGPNPMANLLDFLALSTLTRSLLEEQVNQALPPGALEPLLDASRILETNAWHLAGRVLTTDQQNELRAAIRRWRAQNADAATSFFDRPQDFTSDIRQSGEKESRSGSVFGLVGLDPTSGLDPAVREVTRTRLFAERALFAAARMPILMRWQVESLADRFLRQEQLTNLLVSADRMSRAAESASQTAALLPDRLSAERQAVIEALGVQEGRLRELSTDVGLTLSAGEQMSRSLNDTLVTFDALMKRFGVGEPPRAPRRTNAPPFNILDYAHTTEQAAALAQQLDALLKDASGTLEAPALDRRLADLGALSGQARADAKSVLNHAFLLAAGLLVLGLACAVAYRRIGPRGATAPADARAPFSNI